MTLTAQRPSLPTTPKRPSPISRIIAGARNAWRSLTSMRTALVLLFLLALAAIPGALIPQRSLNAQKVAQYIADRPTLGGWMDKLELFDVFSSFWFTAIYALLFISLIGCVTPRLVEHARALRRSPVAAPRNLARLPHHHSAAVTDTPEQFAEHVRGDLGGVADHHPHRRGRHHRDLGGERLPARGGQPDLPLLPHRAAGGDRPRQTVRLRRIGHRHRRQQPRLLQHLTRRL